MGFWKRAKKVANDYARIVTTDLYQEGVRAVTDDHSKKQLGLKAEPVYQNYESPSPYSGLNTTGSGPQQWDANGFPVGPMPRGDMALDWQYEANRRSETRRQALWGDAQNTMRQGLDLMQSYRPGGSAALASGMYGQKAGLYGNQAQDTEAPDLLMGYRDWQQAKADAERKQAERFARTTAVGSAVAAIAGTAIGGPAVGAALGAGVNALGGAVAPNQNSYNTQAGLSSLGGLGAGGQQAQGGAGQGGGYAYNAQGQPMPGQPMGDQGSYAGPGASGPGLVGGPNPTLQARMGQQSPGGGYGAGGDSGGYGAGGGGGAGAAGPGGGTAMSRGGGASGSYGGPGDTVGGQQGGGMGGGGPLQMFSGQEAASKAMADAPMANPIIYEDWASMEDRRVSTWMRWGSARQRLMDAMSYSYSESTPPAGYDGRPIQMR